MIVRWMAFLTSSRPPTSENAALYAREVDDPAVTRGAGMSSSGSTSSPTSGRSAPDSASRSVSSTFELRRSAHGRRRCGRRPGSARRGAGGRRGGRGFPGGHELLGRQRDRRRAAARSGRAPRRRGPGRAATRRARGAAGGWRARARPPRAVPRGGRASSRRCCFEPDRRRSTTKAQTNDPHEARSGRRPPSQARPRAGRRARRTNAIQVCPVPSGSKKRTGQ